MRSVSREACYGGHFLGLYYPFGRRRSEPGEEVITTTAQFHAGDADVYDAREGEGCGSWLSSCRPVSESSWWKLPLNNYCSLLYSSFSPARNNRSCTTLWKIEQSEGRFVPEDVYRQCINALRMMEIEWMYKYRMHHTYKRLQFPLDTPL